MIRCFPTKQLTVLFYILLLLELFYIDRFKRNKNMLIRQELASILS